MSNISPKQKNEPEFMEDGSKPTDFMDGIAITIIITVIVIGMVYFLAHH